MTGFSLVSFDHTKRLPVILPKGSDMTFSHDLVRVPVFSNSSFTHTYKTHNKLVIFIRGTISCCSFSHFWVL